MKWRHDTDPRTSTGEKMTEAEIDALMAGQEDENGSVHYEGKLQLHCIPPLSLSVFQFNTTSKILTFGSVSLQLSSSTSCLCKRPAAGVLKNSRTVFRTSTLSSKTNQGKTRTMYKGCWSKPILLFYFVFLSISSQKPSSLSRDATITSTL